MNSEPLSFVNVANILSQYCCWLFDFVLSHAFWKLIISMSTNLSIIFPPSLLGLNYRQEHSGSPHS